MPYFSKDFIQYFRELSRNNNKEWFDKNKSRFEKTVKLPFEKFIDDMIIKVGKHEKAINITARDAIFRIYRDVRFSKDKTPYKVQMSAVISAGGRKDTESPGLYLECSHEHVRIYGGVYMPERESLQNLRFYIAANDKEFRKLLNEKKFKTAFGEIRGEKGKVLPAELKEAARSQALIYNKQFYYFAEFPSAILLKDDVADTLVKTYLVCRPMNNFLRKAMA